MADRMVARGQLLGRTRAEVIEMLGPPHAEEYNGDPSVLKYYLGPERSVFSIDAESLQVRFDPDGRVAECWISSN